MEQITSDDLSILSSFLDSKDAQLYILKLTVFKNLAQLTERGMRQPSRIITASASKVCRVCVDFIGRSRSLVEVVFGGLVFTIEGMNRLGSAISRTKSRKLYIIRFKYNYILLDLYMFRYSCFCTQVLQRG